MSQSSYCEQPQPPPAYLIGMAPRTRRSPFYNATVRAGVKAFTVYNHMLMPVYYESLEADYERLVNAVTLWDVAVERQVEISGPDAAEFTQLLTPRNLSTCAVGQCKYVLLTDERGGIINDPLLLKLAEDRFWLSLADSDVLLWAKGVALGSGLDVTIDEPDVSPLQLQGPRSSDVARVVFGDWIEGLRYFWFKEAQVDGIPVVLSRTGYSGERGYEIFVRDGAHADRLWDLVMEAGKPYGIGPCSPSTIRRTEAGILSYGTDMTLENNPYEINLGRLVDLEMDAPFVGKAALAEIARKGPSRRLVGLDIGGDALSSVNGDYWPASVNGELAGRVSTAVRSPTLTKNIGLAMLNSNHTEVGTVVQVHAPDGDRESTIVPVPFVMPKQK